MLDKKMIVNQFLQEWRPEKSLYDHEYDKHEHEQDRLELLSQLAADDLYLKYIGTISNDDLHKIFSSDRERELIESFDLDKDKTLLKFYKRVEQTMRNINPRSYAEKLKKFKDLLEQLAIKNHYKEYEDEFEETYGNHPEH